ncbi:MAG: helix-turn-helix domain-containing protein [Thermoplasmatales archaeon]|nr:MAG: helix-turn-helix domain-containing protein [Thermoplasmatales archaeon]
MKKTPCQYSLWNGIPVIRKEIAVSLTKNFGLTQKETAKKLGITPAAVSQYLSKKRGNSKIIDQDILLEINSTAEKIIMYDNVNIVSETCRICRILKSKRISPPLSDSCDDEK